MKKGQANFEGLIVVIVLLTLMFSIIQIGKIWVAKMHMLEASRNGLALISGGGMFEPLSQSEAISKLRETTPEWERNLQLNQKGVIQQVQDLLGVPPTGENDIVIRTLNGIIQSISGISTYEASCDIKIEPFVPIPGGEMKVKSRSTMVGNPWSFSRFLDFIKGFFRVGDFEK